MQKINLNNYEAFLLDYFDGNLDKTTLDELKAFIIAHPELNTDIEASLPVLHKEDVNANFKKNLIKENTFLDDEDVLNYLENRFSQEQKVAFEKKLAQDEELAKTLEYYKKTIMSVDYSTVMSDKSLLYKTDEKLVLNNRILAYFENQLPDSQKTNLETELKNNSALRAEHELFSKTTLTPDFFIVYPNKESLKKKTKIFVLFGVKANASIAAAILLLIGFTIVFGYYGSQKNKDLKLAHKKNKIEKPKFSAPVINDKQLAYKKEIGNAISKISSNGSRAIIVKRNSKSTTRAKKDSVLMTNSNPAPNYAKDNISKKDSSIDLSQLVNQIIQNRNATQEPYVKDNILLAGVEDKVQKPLTELTILTEEDYENDEFPDENKSKPSFWKRAVAFIGRANKLGLKSLEAEEKNDNSFLLSFNSLVVEKK